MTGHRGGVTRRTLLGSMVALAATPRLSAWAASGTLPVTAINHCALEVPDPARSVAWYQELFGLPIVARHDDGTVVLRVGDGPQSMMISGGGDGKARIKHLCLAVDKFDADRAVEVLKQNGFAEANTPGRMQVTRRIRGDGTGGTPEVFFGDAEGLVVQLQHSAYCGGTGQLGNDCGEILQAAPGEGLLKISDLNHVTCFITNMKDAVGLYQRLFGFQIDTYQGPTPILRVGPGNQQLILVGGHDWPGGNQIDHVCFEVEAFDVERISKVLKGYGVKPQGEAMRPDGRNHFYFTMRTPDRGGAPDGTAEFYFADPDGIIIQLQDARYCGGAGYLGNECGTPENPTGHSHGR